MTKQKRDIEWPIYHKNGKLKKDGKLNGVPFSKIWKQCQKEAEDSFNKKYPNGYDKE